MYLKASATLLLALILLAQASSIAYSQLTYRHRYGVEIATLAVSKEEHSGVFIPVYTEIIWPGSGDISIEYSGISVSEDTKESIRYSIYLAARFSGVRVKDYDYRVVFKTDYSISGLSATLDFTLAFTLLLRKARWNGGVAATGLLAPNGVVGNISGLELKYRAAIEHGYKFVIAPYHPLLYGNRGYIPVSSFIDAYEYFSNDTMYPKYSRGLEELVINNSKPLLEAYYSAWSELYNESNRLLNSTLLSSLHIEQLPASLKRNLDTGIKSINESIEYIRLRKYYTAASRAFYGYWNILSAYLYILYRIYGVEEFNSLVKQWFEGNNTLTTNVLNKYINRKEYSLAEIDVIVNSYERLLDSREIYNESMELMEKGNMSEAATYLAISLARQYTVRQWLSVINSLDHGGYIVSIDTVKEVVVEEASLSKHLVDYLKYLFKGVGVEEIDRRAEMIDYAESIIDKDVLEALACVIRVERDLGNMLLGSPAFTYFNKFVVEGIRESIIRLMSWYLLYYNTVMPSGFTAVEFMETSPRQSLYAVSTALLHLLVLTRIPVIHERALAKEFSVQQELYLASTSFEGILLAILSLAFVAIASSMIGYFIGKKHSEYVYTVRRFREEDLLKEIY